VTTTYGAMGLTIRLDLVDEHLCRFCREGNCPACERAWIVEHPTTGRIEVRLCADLRHVARPTLVPTERPCSKLCDDGYHERCREAACPCACHRHPPLTRRSRS
jgi:hypothetical protein